MSKAARRALLALVLGALAAVGLGAAWDRVLPAPWQRHQRAYNALQVAAGRTAVAEGIRALAPDPQRPERCVSCHLGPVLVEAHPASTSPLLRRHPRLSCAQPLLQLGCVGCHRGDPARLTASRAHAGLLRGEAIQAGCAGCHLSRDRGVLRYDADVAPQVARGQDLFITHGCTACHRVAGVYAAALRGPRLSAVGALRSRAALKERLLRPSRTTPMPPFVGQGPDVAALLTFLQAQVGPRRERGTSAAQAALAEAARPRLEQHLELTPPVTPNRAAGALWMRRAGCVGCHRLSPSDGGVVDLQRVGWYLGEEELREALLQPQRRFPGTFMPPLSLARTVQQSVQLYLSAQRSPLPSGASEVFTEVCARCHGPRPDAKTAVLVKRPPRLIPPPALARFVELATRGSKGTAMAPWGRVLSRGFLEALHARLQRQAPAARRAR